MSGDERTYTYHLEVPQGTDGLVRAGTLRPDGTSNNVSDEQNNVTAQAVPVAPETWTSVAPAGEPTPAAAMPILRGTL